MPGAAAPRPRALRVAQRDEHRRARRIAGRSADRAGAGAGFRRPLSLDRRRSSRTSSSPPRAALRAGRSAQARQGRRNVVEQIERSKQNDLSRLVYALGIRHVGEKLPAPLARHFRTMDAILDASVEELQTVPEIGPVVAASVRTFAEEPHNRALDEAGGGRRQHDEPAARDRRSPRARWPARRSCSPGPWRR